MRSRRPTLLAALASAAVLAGCTTASTGDPTPAEKSTDPATSASVEPTSEGDGGELPFAGAPKVENPLDTRAFQEDPCQAITPEQARQLNVDNAGTPADAPLGNACEWTNTETRGYVQIRFNDANPVGLSGEYQAHEQGKFVYFNELEPIDGFPAVSSDVVDRRPRGVCVVIVGVSDQIEFESAVQLSQANVGQKDPCVAAAEVAGMALRTMKRES